VLPLVLGVALCTYIIHEASSENVRTRTAVALLILAVVGTIIYVPILAKPIFSNDTIRAASAVPDFIETYLLFGNWLLTEGWLTALIVDFVINFSGTELEEIGQLQLILHIFVIVGFVWLAYWYFSPYFTHLFPKNQTIPSNQTSTT
jgi:hypothetical protein